MDSDLTHNKILPEQPVKHTKNAKGGFLNIP
jgi:hypothetical protein